MNKIIFLSISLMLGMQHIHGSQEGITTPRKNGEELTKTTSETYSITKFPHQKRIVWQGPGFTITKDGSAHFLKNNPPSDGVIILHREGKIDLEGGWVFGGLYGGDRVDHDPIHQTNIYNQSTFRNFFKEHNIDCSEPYDA